MVSEEIKNYDVIYYSGPENANYPMRAIISLWGSKGRVAALYFYRKKSLIPSQDKMGPSGYVYCNYSYDELSTVIDLLRNEKPIWFRFYGGVSSIETISEPVGDGELFHP